ncbi:MAG TPA: hypothetical protein VF432_29325 [Thermoanaerobaculia bacterium]
MRWFAVAACLVLLMASEVRAQPTGTAEEAKKTAAAKKAEAELRRDAAMRLIAQRQLISVEESDAALQLADRNDKLLLELVDGKTPISEFNTRIETIDRDLFSLRRKAVHAGMTGKASRDAFPGEEHSVGIGLAVLLSLGSLALSLFLYLRRRHVVQQTLRDAGLL